MTSVGSKQDFSVQWDVHVCIRRPSCLSVVRRIPNTSQLVTETTGKSHGAQNTRGKDTSHHKTVFGFHPCKKYWKWCVLGLSTREWSLPVKCGHRMARSRHTLKKSNKGKCEQARQCLQGKLACYQASRETVSLQRKLLAKRLNSVTFCTCLLNVHTI